MALLQISYGINEMNQVQASIVCTGHALSFPPLNISNLKSSLNQVQSPEYVLGDDNFLLLPSIVLSVCLVERRAVPALLTSVMLIS